MGAAGFHRGDAGTDAGGADSPERGNLEQVSRAGLKSHLGCLWGRFKQQRGSGSPECVPSLRGKVFLLFRPPLPPFQKCGALVYASFIIRLGYYGVTT